MANPGTPGNYDYNPGPASTVTPNAIEALFTSQGSSVGTFASLSAGINPGQTAYTSDQGLAYWTGTAWSHAFANAAPTYGNQITAVLPSGNSDNFSPAGYASGTTDMLILTPTDATSTLLGLAASGVPNGFSVVMWNASPTIDFVIESASSSIPANQFVCPEDATVLLEAYSKVILIYLAGIGWTT